MEEQSKLNKTLIYLKTHRYNLYVLGILVTFFTIIILMIYVTMKISNTNKKTPNSPTISPTTAVIMPTTSDIPAITINPTQATFIYDQIKPDLSKKIFVPYTVKKTTSYGDSWAIIEINANRSDSANVVVKKVNGLWTIVLGPGTSFDPQDLDALGAPSNLKKGANSDF